MLESCLGLLSLIASFVGACLLLLWALWCCVSLALLAAALLLGPAPLRDMSAAPAGPWIWTCVGLVGAVIKHLGDRTARWVYRDALPGAVGSGDSTRSARNRWTLV